MERKPRGNPPAREPNSKAEEEAREGARREGKGHGPDQATGQVAGQAVGQGAGQAGSRSGPDPLYWASQDAALDRARKAHADWMQARREAASPPKGRPTRHPYGNRTGSRAGSQLAGARPAAVAWKRETFQLPRAEAQARAREFLRKYPKAAYWSEVESWRELPDGQIEFTMRRLPSAD